ncbi:hypothetical protein DFA_01146 [Cavenderia fasciculata]|uniref:Uncharacterized protein n=1 Tax=Cavenderia fasciculata TaxID=261658 RepID=F4PR67_CACFS|nr:uncharacterized protein DFA_01146 [Cavenderia fasciculata]EGG21267.1 hypothetical protein DFA_01146 [Cavenderia fasciculata]|eukprot:XP_004359117.1 hypothetical protein DFA_01146 [Cavenderia fasciculata]
MTPLYLYFKGATGATNLPFYSITHTPTRVIFEKESSQQSMESPYVLVCNCKNLFDPQTYFKDSSKSGNIQVLIKHFLNDHQPSHNHIQEWYTNLMKEISSSLLDSSSTAILLYITNQKISNPEKLISEFNQYCKDNNLENRYLLLFDHDTFQIFLSPTFSHLFRSSLQRTNK